MASPGAAATVVYPYQAKNDHELTVGRGAKVTIVQANDAKNWWKVCDAYGTTGYVPKTYLKIEEGAGHTASPPPATPRRRQDAPPRPSPSPRGSSFSRPSPQPEPRMAPIPKVRRASKEGTQQQSLHEQNDLSEHAELASRLRSAIISSQGAARVEDDGAGEANVCTATVLYAYNAASHDEISITEGETLTVLSRPGDGWCVASKSDGKQGWCPESYIKMGEEDDGGSSRRDSVMIVVAQFAFHGESEGDLSFDEGEEFIVLNRHNEEWLLVRRLQGTQDEGYIPSNYVRQVEDSTDDYIPVEGDDDEEEEEESAEGSFEQGDMAHLDAPWYHESISRREAELLLYQRGRKGSFLVRPSQETQGQFSVSVNGGDRVKHFRILRNQQNGKYEFGERKFATISDLVHFYGTYSIFTTAQQEGICLENPLPPVENEFSGLQ
eukprot:m.4383 g.4383  ORF g.4383 m.4383 type:complete len:438 (+) comp2971_c0_seq1:119-1432(+)